MNHPAKGHHGLPVVAATAVVAFPLPEALQFCCDASISHAFIARLLLAFAFKWRMNLVHIIEGVHRIALKLSQKPPLKKVEEEEGRRRSQRAKCGGESRDRHSISLSFSFLSFFLLFFFDFS